MTIKIKDIPNALVEKKICQEYLIGEECDCGIGYFNEAIDQQGEIDIGLNRDRLAKLLFKNSFLDRDWNREGEYFANQRKHFFNLADAIIAAESTLLEVKK